MKIEVRQFSITSVLLTNRMSVSWCCKEPEILTLYRNLGLSSAHWKKATTGRIFNNLQYSRTGEDQSTVINAISEFLSNYRD